MLCQAVRMKTSSARKMSRLTPHFLAAVVILVAPASLLRADLSLETETARLLAPGKFEFSTALEIQHSRTGQEFAVPMALEIGLFKRLELLIEPVVFTAIVPSSKAEPKATGIGDIETTLTFLVLEEKAWLPAMAVAAEIKIPTARDQVIGTGETDYTGYFILSKRIGKLDISGNLAYTVLGKPKGITLHNIYSWAVSLDYQLTEKFDLLAEVLGNTPSGAKDNANMATPNDGESPRMQMYVWTGNEQRSRPGPRGHRVRPAGRVC